MRSFILGLVMAAAMSGLATQASYAAMSDEATAQLIANDLKESGRLKDYRVGVKFKDGVAWLTGTVTSRQQRQAAELIVGNSEGVIHVVSKLEIESPQNQQPQQGLRVARADVSPRGSKTSVSPRDSKTSVSPRDSKTSGSLRGSKTSGSPRGSKTSGRSASRRPIQNNMPVPYARMGQGVQAASYGQPAQFCTGCNQMPGGTMGPAAVGHVPAAMGQAVSYDNPQVPGYAWPSYAAAPNYAALTYPKQYSASAWPYIGPFYPYPQVPLGWRKVTLEWDDGWWFLDFKDGK